VDIKSVEDPFIKDALDVAEGFESAGVPGRFLVEMIPALKYLPDWMPGAGFKRWARRYRQAALNVLNKPFDFVYEKHVRIVFRLVSKMRADKYVCRGRLRRRPVLQRR